ncbi:MAG: FtsX-like permease family protein [Pseudomonadota bacterium]|nr:FtsX-like permease family protein [Pseudomonadota bacterium]
MNLSLLLNIGYHQISSKLHNKHTRLVQRVASLSLAISAFILIVVLSVFNGFQNELQTIINHLSPHLVLELPSQGINRDTLIHSLNKHHMVQKVDTDLKTYGFIATTPPTPLIISGKNNNYSKLKQQQGKQTHPSLDYLDTSIPKNLAWRFNLNVGDYFPVIVARYDKNQQLVSQSIRCFVKNILPSSFSMFSEQTLMVDQDQLAQLTQSQQPYNEISITLKSLNAIEDVTAIIHDTFPEINVQNASQQALFIQESLSMQKRMMFVVLSLLTLMGVFNLSTSLTMIIKEREQEIALLQTMGLTPSHIQSLFTLSGIIITTRGILLGLGLGVPCAYYLNSIVTKIESMFNVNISNNVFIFNNLPTQVSFFDMLTIIICTYLLCLMTVLPVAKQAALIDPADKLRYE